MATAAAPATPGNAAPTTIPYVATHHDLVRDMLWMAGVGTNDVVYDLGSGDGRVAIAAARDFHARKAVGIELDPALVQASRSNAQHAGVSDRVTIVEGDLFEADFSDATVVVLFLGQTPNIGLRSKILRTLKPGTRVVSHQFGMGEWPPDRRLEVRRKILGMYSEMHNPFGSNPDVPDHRTAFAHRSQAEVFQWVVPAPVAGVWRGRLRGGGEGDRELTLTLRQRLSKVTGSFALGGGPTNLAGSAEVELWGDRLRFHGLAENRSLQEFQLWFEGSAQQHSLTGKVWFTTREGTREFRWDAQRDPADFAGTWEWPGPSGSPVQLKIQRQDGRWAATYLDPQRETTGRPRRGEPVVVEDFYDCGGGLYFTLLLGEGPQGNLVVTSHSGSGGRVARKSAGRRMGPEDGWLIGEALAGPDGLEGTISFFPYPNDLFRAVEVNPGPGSPAATPANARRAVQEGSRAWRPKRIGP